MSDSKKFTLIGATGAILSIVVLFIALFMQPTKWSKSAEKILPNLRLNKNILRKPTPRHPSKTYS